MEQNRRECLYNLALARHRIHIRKGDVSNLEHATHQVEKAPEVRELNASPYNNVHTTGDSTVRKLDKDIVSVSNNIDTWRAIVALASRDKCIRL